MPSEPDSNGKKWYCVIGDNKLGPLSAAQLKELTVSGKLTPDDWVWRDGLPKWVSAKSVKGLFPLAHVEAPPIQSPPVNCPASPDASKREVPGQTSESTKSIRLEVATLRLELDQRRRKMFSKFVFGYTIISVLALFSVIALSLSHGDQSAEPDLGEAGGVVSDLGYIFLAVAANGLAILLNAVHFCSTGMLGRWRRLRRRIFRDAESRADRRDLLRQSRTIFWEALLQRPIGKAATAPARKRPFVDRDAPILMYFLGAMLLLVGILVGSRVEIGVGILLGAGGVLLLVLGRYLSYLANRHLRRD